MTIRDFYAELLERDWLREESLILSYEDLDADAQGIFDRSVFPFLGLPSYTVHAKHRKQNTRPLDETISNYEELLPYLNEPWLWQDYATVFSSDESRRCGS